MEEKRYNQRSAPGFGLWDRNAGFDFHSEKRTSGDEWRRGRIRHTLGRTSGNDEPDYYFIRRRDGTDHRRSVSGKSRLRS